MALDNSGYIGTTATMGPIDSLRHITSVTHIAAAVTLPVNCVAGCAGSSGQVIAHVSSVTHVAAASPLPVTGTFWPSTQPISGTVTATQGAPPWTVSQSGAWSVNVAHVSGALHVAGTVPVIGTVTANAGTGTFGVSGTVTSNQGGTWTVQQGTPPWAVNQSGAWTVNVGHVSGALHLAGTVPVSGTFWQTTQPVSLATAPTTPVTGTFWQATQPVSGTVTANAGSGTFTVGGTVTAQAGTGSLTVNQGGQWAVQAHQQGAWTTSHISSVVHIAAAGGPWPVSMALATRCVNTAGTGFEACGGAGGGADAVNVFHQSTVAHVSSVTHVAGAVQIQNQAGTQRVVVTSTGGGSLQVECTAGCGTPTEPATYYAYYDRVAPAANKYMATLFNASATRKVVVRRVWWINNSITAVTGVILDQYAARITVRTAGTSVTIQAVDTSDSLSAGITADTNSTVVTEDHIAKRFIAASEEPTTAQTQLPVYGGPRGLGTLIYQKESGTKGLTLRQNQGFSIRNVTSSTVGVVSYLIEFSDEAA